MIRKLLKELKIEMSDQEFKEILQMTTDDIRENRIKFNRRTYLPIMLSITLRSLVVLEQWNKKSPLPRAKKNL